MRLLNNLEIPLIITNKHITENPFPVDISYNQAKTCLYFMYSKFNEDLSPLGTGFLISVT
jgi:hypothetical protein